MKVKKKSNVYFSEKSFIEAISLYVEYGVKPQDERFILNSTPKIYKKIGYDDMQFVCPRFVVDKAIYGKYKYYMSKRQLLETLKEFFHPLFVFKSDALRAQTTSKSRVIITSIIASENELFGITFYPGDTDRYDKTRRHIITSIHKRTCIAKNKLNLLEKDITNGLCEYINERRIRKIKKEQSYGKLLGLIAVGTHSINSSHLK